MQQLPIPIFSLAFPDPSSFRWLLEFWGVFFVNILWSAWYWEMQLSTVNWATFPASSPAFCHLLHSPWRWQWYFRGLGLILSDVTLWSSFWHTLSVYQSLHTPQTVPCLWDPCSLRGKSIASSLLSLIAAAVSSSGNMSQLHSACFMW